MPAGFMIRLGALVLDVIIVVIPLYILSLLNRRNRARTLHEDYLVFIFLFSSCVLGRIYDWQTNLRH